MQKFSITDLERARKYPIEFAKALKEGESAIGFGGYPKSMRWLNAIIQYHHSKNIADAFKSIENAFNNRKDTSQNRREVGIFLNSVHIYVKGVEKEKLSLVNSRESINISLSNSVRITGLIPIILMKPTNGFISLFVSRGNPSWLTEIKYPIIQDYVANHVFKSELKDIEVGYINFETGEFYRNCYTKEEVDAASRELRKIGKIISDNL